MFNRIMFRIRNSNIVYNDVTEGTELITILIILYICYVIIDEYFFHSI